jgi:hypothetical protein
VNAGGGERHVGGRVEANEGGWRGVSLLEGDSGGRGSGGLVEDAPLDRAKGWRRSHDLMPPPSTRTVRQEFGEK